MWVRLGNSNARVAYREEVSAAESPPEQLRELAERRTADAMTDGAIALDDNPSPEVLAARLSSQMLFRQLPDNRVTEIHFPEGTTVGEALTTLTGPRGIWGYHSDAAPAWVESDNDGLAQLLCDHWGCTRGVPADVEETHWTEAGPPGIGPDGPAEVEEGGKK